ncbi:hypothetical protein GQR58_003580 [Nymphon striatum]|nr:hypothetical protein GQR58_003580 [Nymphon striatum]
MVEELRTASNKVGLEINLSKNKVIFNRNVEIQPIMRGNVALDQVDRYTYLGQLISIHIDWETEVRRRVALAWQAFGRLNNVWCSKLPLCLKRKAMLETGSGIGYTVGPLFGGVVYEKTNFESPLIITGALSFSVFILSFITMNDVPAITSRDTDDRQKINYLKSFLKIPAFYIIFVTNMLPFIILTNYDIVYVLYTSLELKVSTTFIGIVLFIAGIFYAGTATLSGLFVDKKYSEETELVELVEKRTTARIWCLVY